jgi:hypothetical protein
MSGIKRQVLVLFGSRTTDKEGEVNSIVLCLFFVTTTLNYVDIALGMYESRLGDECLK